METTTALVETLKALDAADVPAELRPIAFKCAFHHLTASAGGVAATPSPGGFAKASASVADGSDVASISTRLGLAPDLIGDVFDFSDEEPRVVIPASKLDREKASASKQLALLVTAARQAAAREDWTSTGVIRDVCRDYGKLDSANFATSILGMGSVFNFRGKGQQREVKLNRRGLEAAADLIRDLTE